MEKIWLDTDIGTDIDDAYALAYLLARKDCEIVGISTVTHDTLSRAKLARVICDAYGKKVPVYAGSRARFCDDFQTNDICMDSIEAVRMYNQDFEPNQHEVQTGIQGIKEIQPKSAEAIEAMRKAIVSNPGNITLIAIGPLTNVARMFSIYPETKKLLKKIVVMGGRYTEDSKFDTSRWGVNEWNIVCDPHAAKIVLGSDVTEGLVVGIEVTVEYFKENVDLYAIIEKFDCLKALQFMTLHRKIMSQPASHRIWFHDPLACALAFEPELFETSVGVISVDLEGAKPGKTIFTPNTDGKWKVAGHFKGRLEAYFQHYINILSEGSK